MINSMINIITKKNLTILTVGGLAISLVMIHPATAHARGRTFEGSRGGSRTIDRSRDSGNLDRTVSETGRKGRTRTKDTTGSVADGKFTGKQNITRANGSTATRDVSASKNADGSYTTTVTGTGKDGQTVTKTSTASYDKDTHTVTKDTSVTDGDKTATRTSTESYDKDTHTVTKDSTTTQADGDVHTRTTTATGSGDNGEVSGSITTSRDGGKEHTFDFSGNMTRNP